MVLGIDTVWIGRGPSLLVLERPGTKRCSQKHIRWKGIAARPMK